MTEIFKITEDMDGQSFTLKPMPNHSDLTQNIMEIKCGYPGSAYVNSRFILYVWHNGEIVPMEFGRKIINMLKSCLTGFYGTPDGQFLKHENPGVWYSDDKGNVVHVGQYDLEDEEDIIGTERTDIVSYEPINILSPMCNKSIEFDIVYRYVPAMDKKLVDFQRIRIVDSNPIVDTNEDKERIIEMYGKLPTLKQIYDNKVQELIDKGFLVNEVATRQRFEILNGKGA